MTVAELAAEACADAGVEEAHVQERAKAFVRRRLRYIWNRFAWKESLILFRITPESLTVEDVPEGTIPVGKVYELPVDRVLAVGVQHGNILRPTSLINAFQRGADVWDAEGVAPCEVVEMGAGATEGTRLVRIITPLAGTANLIVLGKKICPTLEDTDNLPLTGIDEAIIPMVTGDLWKVRRQGVKAASYYQEAEAMVARMQDVETKQGLGRKRLVASPMGGYYNSDTGPQNSEWMKTAGTPGFLWELDGDGNIVPVVTG